ncbi:MAG TPA: GTP 3',8-cyclase MoaA [Gemmatimonadales bacterium]
MDLRDTFGRPLGSLRISVTDRCNLRCAYCMPENEYVWLPRASILTLEETARLARVFVSLGVTKLRLTGGEPLLRTDLPFLVGQLCAIPGVGDLAMTTNAVLLAKYAAALRAAGLQRVTVSLDSLRGDRYRDLTRAERLPQALDGIAAAAAAGLGPIKLNMVVMRDVNDDEVIDMLEFGRERDIEVRFIEYMDVGGATNWSMDRVVSRADLLRDIQAHYGAVIEHPASDLAAPAERFLLPDGRAFGIIASTTQPFCRTCDRSRLTADGVWFLCLYAADGIDLKRMLRGGAADDQVADEIRRVWSSRADRGAEQRAALPARGALYQVDGLRVDPHREMHTRGG